MATKKIVAANMRRALEIAREQLGPEAIILSTRRHPDGIELVATVEQAGQLPEEEQPFAAQKSDHQQWTAPLASDNAWQHQELVNEAIRQQPVAPSAGRPFGGKTGQQLADEIEAARRRILSERSSKPAPQAEAGDLWASGLSTAQSARQNVGPAPRQTPPPQSHAQAQQPAPASLGDDPDKASRDIARLHSELAHMRALLTERLDNLGSTPAQPVTGLVHKMVAFGLPAYQAERICAAVNDELPAARAWPEALAILSQRLPVAGRDLVAQGGIFAFVGPTGVGKTTSLAKLAVRHVIAHGPASLGLITTDNYRLAAHEQLTALGRILSVPVKVLGEQESLSQVLTHMSHKKLILIDTAGLRPGDPKLANQLAQLTDAGNVHSLLVLAANSQPQMLKASLHAYSNARPAGLVLTKLDETPCLGQALGAVLSQRLPLVYSTDGQEIPADIELAKGHKLVARAAAGVRGSSEPEQPAIKHL